jgi:DNA polymerase elongation subunit (family B)
MIFFDLETDGTDPKKANLKFAGFMDEQENFTMYDYTQNEQIKDFVKKHKILSGFNIKGFDVPIIERFGCEMKYKVLVDLWEALAPKGDNGDFGIYNKDRLKDINPSLKMENYKIKTFIETLGLDKEGTKGEIDYNLFKKDSWTEKERKEIEKYLKQDLKITKILFDWYKKIFEPLEAYLDSKDVEKCKHLTSSSGCVAYKCVCKQAGLKEEYNDKETSKELKRNAIKIEGGYHLKPTFSKVRGNIICRDFVSQYPHNLVMYNLLPEKQLKAVETLLTERLKAKASGDKATALALKVPLNSMYGVLGNSSFKNMFNPEAGANCTRIGREHIRRYAKTIEVAGFVPVYGFTDSCYVGIPKGLTEEDLDLVTKHFVEQIKKEAPNPLDSYGLGVDGKYKFMWFLGLNNYLYVTQNNKVDFKGGALFDKNAPQSVLMLFENYITPKILKELDVVFSKEELLNQLKNILEKNTELAGEEYSVKSLKDYNSTTSLQYQISQRYGEGKHILIPNEAGVGVGRSDNLRYCSIEEFNEQGLSVESICLNRMMKYLKPFYEATEDVVDLDTPEGYQCYQETLEEVHQ